MQLTIHRGTKQIGGTCIELCSGNTRIILDYGMPLTKPGEKEVAEPKLFDIPGLYRNQAPKIDGILISHSHKDHYGMLNYLNPDIPVYLSDGVNKLIDVLNIFTRNNTNIAKPYIIKHKICFDIGNFHITPYLVDHSGFDAMSFLVEEKTTGKRLFYSGDFRATGWKRALFDRFINKPPINVDCLLMEGTMIDRENGKYADEQAVLDGVQEVLNKSKNNIVLTYCSGQNIDRIVAFYKAARRAKATLIIDPYIATVLHILRNARNTIPQIDWKNIKVLVGDYRGEGDMYIKKMMNSKIKSFVRDVGKHKIKTYDIGNEKCLIVMRNAIIRLVKRIRGIKGSTLIYSQWDGYIRDKKKAREFWDFVNENDLKIEYIHTSGHATVDYLQKLVNAIKPARIVPIHTERPEKYKELFKGHNVQMLEDGQTVEI